jgi:hypothetical protein
MIAPGKRTVLHVGSDHVLHPRAFNPFIWQNRLYGSILGAVASLIDPGAARSYGRSAELAAGRFRLPDSPRLVLPSGLVVQRQSDDYAHFLEVVFSAAYASPRSEGLLNRHGQALLLIRDLPSDSTQSLLTMHEAYVRMNVLARRVLPPWTIASHEFARAVDLPDLGEAHWGSTRSEEEVPCT